MAITFPTVTDALDWPSGERSVRSDVRGLVFGRPRHQMAVRVRRGLRLLELSYGFLGVMAIATLTVVAGHGLP
jgi:hypothetical protein